MIARLGSPRGRAGLLTLGLAAVVLGLAQLPGSAALEQKLTRRSVPQAALGSPKLRRALTQVGVLSLQPPRELLAARRPGADGRCPPLQLGAGIAPDQMPSTTLVPGAWQVRQHPVVSLYLDPCRLARLVENPGGFGEGWEEPGWVSYFVAGELRFASAVGVRLHGGFGRRSAQNKSFRLEFRERFGAAGFPAEALAPGFTGAVDSLVLHNDLRHDIEGHPWHFVNPLGYDIGRVLGGHAPATRPAWLVLNGAPRQAYVLTERIESGFLARRFGHDDFELIRAKGDRPPAEQALWEEARRWAVETPAPLTRAAVEEHFDLDNLTRWYLTVLFCGTGDVFQAAMVRDRTGATAGGRWFWVHWDLDMSFRVPPRGFRQPGWKKDLFGFVKSGPRGLNIVPRILLWRLLNEDPEYCAELARRVEEMLQHELSPDALAALLARQHQIAADLELGPADRKYLVDLEEFFRERPAELRRQVGVHLR